MNNPIITDEKTLVRMPPSPTGQAHLGTARTMLINYIFTKSKGGNFLYRSEDTDRERSTRENERSIIDSLTWLQMPVMDECTLFIRQTECTDVYAKYMKELWDAGHIFACFTSKEEVENQKEEATKNHTNFVFWSKHRELTREQQETKIAAGESYVFRLKCPKNKILTWTDGIRGDISVNSDTLGDFAVARSDQSMLYVLANVIDDLTQNITHVIRGEDHVANTPKQLLCYDILNATPPHIAHLPNIMDSTGKKLSKRRAPEGVAVMVDDFRTMGFVPEGVINGILFLGWNPKTTQEIFSLQEVIDVYDMSQNRRANPQYNFDRMLWFNHEWLKKLSDKDRLVRYNQWLLWTGEQAVDDTTRNQRALKIAAEKHKIFNTMAEDLSYTMSDSVAVTKELLLSAGKETAVETAQKVLSGVGEVLQNWENEDIAADEFKQKIIENIKSIEMKTRDYMPIFRVAMSGKTPSTGPIDVAYIIGKTESLRRIQGAIDALTA